jgi:hypothetical protein
MRLTFVQKTAPTLLSLRMQLILEEVFLDLFVGADDPAPRVSGSLRNSLLEWCGARTVIVLPSK